ncbi:hypothetical protein GCM10022243_14190 [Saccharothrix violaceirubra]|uniref:3-oxoacyl-(Acyl-carrier-protein) synthase/NAD(P)-dependent dehydrogenase (Short-subunit alcohol dehydrogenase family) n=1 Tax=Saccharothrix violaceirubra TaxID=413306 RepID=A0A7W7WY35_9PSEU|nr:SDR family oxidoreductase [Saccharothrix violaceirubra]MBB4967293.1 3-oxoacyl-(acyl-carrier-protein) synthase/NAD(P)-dependent dehydrogenase (short-subunit alcohol dehydrogenase family) [Saccharothrix violaceirubra]
MTGPLGGRVALVTGGAGSVGERIVRGLAEAGATVLINCFHSYDAGRRLADDLVSAGHHAEVMRASVAKPAQVERMVAEVDRTHGSLDILVNNAAAGTFASWDELTEEHLDQAFATNVKGALWCARAARPLLARGTDPCIVNVSSIGASHAPANYLPVGIAKAALESLTRYLAAEFAEDGIRVNTASAALLDNEVGRRFPGADSVRANTVAATPAGRLGDPDDLADVVLLLASPGSRFVTGQTLLADGGLSLMRHAMAPTPSTPSTTASSTLHGDERHPVRHSRPTSTDPATDGESPSRVTTPDPVGSDHTTASVPTTDRPSLPTDPDPVVVVGMGLAVPGASDPDGFWRLLERGGEQFVEVPPDRWPAHAFHDDDPDAPDKTYQSRSGFITDFTPHPRLEPDFAADPTAKWLRHSAIQALEHVTTRPGDRFSVCVGYTPDGSPHLQEALVRGELEALADPEHAAEVAAFADRVLPGSRTGHLPLSHRIGQDALRGLVPDDARLVMVDTACSSSLYAIDLGIRDLVAGRADVAVCGGAFALAPPGSVLFAKVRGLSRTGAVRALDRDADGVLFSDGAGVVVAKRLSRALADGDAILGVLAGSGLSADGRGKAIYAPSSGGQSLAISRALARTGIGPADVDWVIAHATGTPAGDEAEFTALRDAYSSGTVQVTSNKSLIGHTGWAAGVVSVIQALLALRHGRIPAQHRFTAVPERFGIEGTGLTVPTESVPWPARADRPRTVAVSGFGFGGTNAHLLVQEYRPGRANRSGYGTRAARPAVVVGWSTHLADGGTFGDAYPHPPFHLLRMPAAAVRATDRTQLAILECVDRLPAEVRAVCEAHHARVGVVVGHTGPTRSASLYGLRAYLDALDEAADTESVKVLLKRARHHATGLIGAPTEDSFPGGMPNVIAARPCNRFDLRGLNVAVDGGDESLSQAFATARRYLEFGDVDLVLVAGVHGNTLPSWRALTDSATPPTEGAALFAVATGDLAEATGLPVLAELTEESP